MDSLLKALLLDIGGVLMTNGWDTALRKRTAEHFGVEIEEMNSRHTLIFDTYETGKLSFDEYLNRILFFKERNFALEEVKRFIFSAVQPFEEMIEFIRSYKKLHGLKVGVVSNEGRELAVDRIHRFKLEEFVDFFVVSSFVHFRKPDPDIYRLAIDVAQVPPSQIAYIDDRELLVEVGKGLGLQGIHHKGVDGTRAALDMMMHARATT